MFTSLDIYINLAKEFSCFTISSVNSRVYPVKIIKKESHYIIVILLSLNLVKVLGNCRLLPYGVLNILEYILPLSL